MEKITRINYDFNMETALFEKSIFQPEVDPSKRLPLAKGIESVTLKIRSSKKGLLITGNKANGISTDFGPAYELKYYSDFYVTKSREVVRGQEFVYLWLLYPYVSRMDFKLAIYLFEKAKVDEIVKWEEFNKWMITDFADFLLSKNLKTLLKEDKLFK